MLTRLRLRGMKSFADAEAPFGPLTLLLGANASGKTNVLEAVRLLGALVGDLAPLRHALRESGEGAEAGVIRGGAREIVRNGSDSFSIESTWRTASGRTLAHDLTCAIRPELEVRSERLHDPLDSSVWLQSKALSAPLSAVDGTAAGRAGVLEWSMIHDGAVTHPSMAISTDGSALREVFRFIPESPARRLAQGLSAELMAVKYLDITPARMRNYVPADDAKLHADGGNLSAVLSCLCDDPEAKRGLVDWLSALCAPELADLELSRTDEGSVMLRLVEKDGIKVSARSLSDGTLRFLGELVALRTALPGSVILMEEIGRDVHPSRMHLLVEYLESVTEERGIQVIGTTHSPDVLAALGPQARSNAVVLGRMPDRPGTTMRRLGDIPHFEEVVARRGLADLFTMGWLEQAVSLQVLVLSAP